MIARTHDIAAISALIVIFVSLTPQSISLSTIILAIIANMVGGIFPDIDQPTAPFWRNLPVGKYIGKIFDHMLGGHRFLTHSILGIGIIGYLVWLFLNFLAPIMPGINLKIVWWSFMIGILSHLVIDTFNKEGVPWLLPIPIKIGLPPLKAWRITTDGFVENWIVFPGIIIFDLAFIFHNYHHIIYLLKNTIN